MSEYEGTNPEIDGQFERYLFLNRLKALVIAVVGSCPPLLFGWAAREKLSAFAISFTAFLGLIAFYLWSSFIRTLLLRDQIAQAWYFAAARIRSGFPQQSHLKIEQGPLKIKSNFWMFQLASFGGVIWESFKLYRFAPTMCVAMIGIVLSQFIFFYDLSRLSIEGQTLVRQPILLWFLRRKIDLRTIRGYRRLVSGKNVPIRNRRALRWLNFFDDQMRCQIRVCTNIVEAGLLEQWAKDYLVELPTCKDEFARY